MTHFWPGFEAHLTSHFFNAFAHVLCKLREVKLMTLQNIGPANIAILPLGLFISDVTKVGKGGEHSCDTMCIFVYGSE